MFVAIAIHHAKPEHVEDLQRHMHRVIAVVGDAAGLHEFSSWREVESSRLVAISRWESQDAFVAALPAITSLRDRRRPEWSAAEDEVLMLSPSE